MLIEKRIVKHNDKWCVYSEDGTKNLGCGPSETWATKRLAQVEYFKTQHKSLVEEGIVAAIEDGTFIVTDDDLNLFIEKHQAGKHNQRAHAGADVTTYAQPDNSKENKTAARLAKIATYTRQAAETAAAVKGVIDAPQSIATSVTSTISSVRKYGGIARSALGRFGSVAKTVLGMGDAAKKAHEVAQAANTVRTVATALVPLAAATGAAAVAIYNYRYRPGYELAAPPERKLLSAPSDIIEGNATELPDGPDTGSSTWQIVKALTENMHKMMDLSIDDTLESINELRRQATVFVEAVQEMKTRNIIDAPTADVAQSAYDNFVEKITDLEQAATMAEEKHLAGKHDQQRHAGESSSKQGVVPIIRINRPKAFKPQTQLTGVTSRASRTGMPNEVNENNPSSVLTVDPKTGSINIWNSPQVDVTPGPGRRQGSVGNIRPYPYDTQGRPIPGLIALGQAADWLADKAQIAANVKEIATQLVTIVETLQSAGRLVGKANDLVSTAGKKAATGFSDWVTETPPDVRQKLDTIEELDKNFGRASRQLNEIERNAADNANALNLLRTRVQSMEETKQKLQEEVQQRALERQAALQSQGRIKRKPKTKADTNDLEGTLDAVYSAKDNLNSILLSYADFIISLLESILPNIEDVKTAQDVKRSIVNIRAAKNIAQTKFVEKHLAGKHDQQKHAGATQAVAPVAPTKLSKMDQLKQNAREALEYAKANKKKIALAAGATAALGLAAYAAYKNPTKVAAGIDKLTTSTEALLNKVATPKTPVDAAEAKRIKLQQEKTAQDARDAAQKKREESALKVAEKLNAAGRTGADIRGTVDTALKPVKIVAGAAESAARAWLRGITGLQPWQEKIVPKTKADYDETIEDLHESLLLANEVYSVAKSALYEGAINVDTFISIRQIRDDIAGYTEPVIKHLMGSHVQETHGHRGVSSFPKGSKQLVDGSRLTRARLRGAKDMHKALVGKQLGNRTISHIAKSGNSKTRLVKFTDGSIYEVPAPFLGKIAYGPGTNTAVGKLFPTTNALHKNGFVSYQQAHYLHSEYPKVFWKIVQSSKQGLRRWDSKTNRMIIAPVKN